MKKKLVFALAAVIAAAGLSIWWIQARAHRHQPAARANPHADGIDRQMIALKAMLAAPEGATPCETAWNAFKAGDEAGRLPGRTRVVMHLAPHDEFLSRCNALPAAAQPCLAPTWSRNHRDECARARPAPELLEPIVELRAPMGAQAGERDGDAQFMSTQKH